MSCSRPRRGGEPGAHQSERIAPQCALVLLEAELVQQHSAVRASVGPGRRGQMDQAGVVRRPSSTATRVITVSGSTNPVMARV